MMPTAPQPTSTQAFEPTTSESAWTVGRGQWQPDVSVADDWFEVALRKLQELPLLPVNWNTYTGPRIAQDAVSATAFLLALVQSIGPNTIAPFIAPTSEGYVHVKWNRDDSDMEIDVEPSGELHYTLYRQDDIVAEGSVMPETYPQVASLAARAFSR